MSYANISELRAYLPQIKADSSNDALLATILERANEIVNDALGFAFAPWGAAVTTKDVLCRYGGCWLEVPYHKPASVTLVQAIGSRGTTYESASDETDWLEEADGRLYRGGGWGAGAWYRITAVWGYGVAPASVVEIELRIARTLWRNRDAAIGQGSIGVDGSGSVDVRSLSWDERNIIEGVRNRYLGVVHA